MGFGLLLCAYFLFSFMSVAIADYCFATFIIGALVASRAIRGLKDYNPRFGWLYPFAALYGLLAVYHALVVLGGVEGIFFEWNLPIGTENGIDGFKQEAGVFEVAKRQQVDNNRRHRNDQCYERNDHRG